MDEDDQLDDARAIVNPERSEAAAELAGLTDAEIIEPGAADEIAKTAQAAVDDGADTIAAVGGDGTQRTVADVVAGTETDLTVVPGGTVNLLARILGVDTIADAADAMVDGPVLRLDLGRCGERPFILNSSSGYDAAVIAKTGDNAKRFGRGGFVAVGLALLATSRSRYCTVVVDGETLFEGDSLTVLVLNVGQRGSPSFKLAPNAEPDDGVLDVVVISGGRRAMIRAALARIRDRIPRSADAVLGQGTAVTVRWDEPVNVQCDGDAIDSAAEINYTIEPGAVRVRVPAAKPDRDQV